MTTPISQAEYTAENQRQIIQRRKKEFLSKTKEARKQQKDIFKAIKEEKFQPTNLCPELLYSKMKGKQKLQTTKVERIYYWQASSMKILKEVLQTDGR